MQIKNLISGGIITNYSCTSRCRHCLYNCSPSRDKTYLDKESAVKYFEIIRSMGCGAVHVGGGEPFLKFDDLKEVIRAASETGVSISYIETNASWYKNESTTVSMLRELIDLGVMTLLVSISPFHNEYIPFSKTKGVLEACSNIGMSIFPWIADFLYEINIPEITEPHSLDEYMADYGDDYVIKIPERYWVNFGGRAACTYSKIMDNMSVNDILAQSSPCTELLDTTHFHIDLYGSYIPGLCSGLAIDARDLGKPLTDDKYPITIGLAEKGVRALFDFGAHNYGFTPGDTYLNKCHLCQEIRKYIVIEKDIESRELQPVEFYREIPE